MIDPTFTPTQKQAIEAQLAKWKNAGNANVTFKVVEPSQVGGGATSGGPPILSIMRQVPRDQGATAQGETRGWSLNGSRGDTFMEINPGVTDATAFIHVVSHELGHTFGLDDCNTCAQGSTAMTLPQSPSLNAAGGYDGPTTCDNDMVPTNGNYSPPAGGGGGGGNGGSCPNTNCNEGSGFASDECQWGTEGCPSGYFNAAGCCQPYTMSPILIDVDGSGFQMTDAVNGVLYDFYGIQLNLQISWTARGSTNAWLVLDRNGNGVIDNAKEMFGNITPQPRSLDANGFLALAEYDKAANGGNSDGVIDHNDAIFPSLRLWQDKSHNAVSEWWELHTLPDLNVESISLDFRESKRADQYGNQFRYRAKVKDSKGVQLGRWAWDGFLVKQ